MRRMLSWIAVGPTLACGTLLWFAVIALLPTIPAGIAAFAFVALLARLYFGGCERLAVVLLTGARALSPAENARVQPLRAILTEHGFQTREYYANRNRDGGPTATPIGRHSTLLSPAMLKFLANSPTGGLGIAVLLADAEAGRLASGSMRHDLAGRFLELPWRGAASGLQRAGRIVGWLPGSRLVPPFALVLGAAAIWMAADEHVWWLVAWLLLACGLCVGTPLARRIQSRRLRVAADELIVAHGLGRELLTLLNDPTSSSDAERVSRVDQLVNRPGPRLRLVGSAAQFP